METNMGTTGVSGSSTEGMESGQGTGTGGLMERGKERVRSSVDESKARIARSLGTVASSLKDSGGQMRDGEVAAVGGVVEKLADQIDRAANYLERTDAEEIVGGVERFARKNPALFIGAAFALGVLGARFLKSSQSRLAPSFEGGMDTPSYGDREVRTAPIGGADLATGSTGTGTVTGSQDLASGLD